MFDASMMQTAMASLQSAIRSLNGTTLENTTETPITSQPTPSMEAPSKPTKPVLREVTGTDHIALEEIANTLSRSHKQLVITGAGISTSCGIPDFRSKDGLYRMIPQQTRLPTPPETVPSSPSPKKRCASRLDATEDVSPKRRKIYNSAEDPPCSQTSTLSRSSSFNSTSSRLKGEDLFHARVFHGAETTTLFYQFIASLRSSILNDVKDASDTHKFIRVLRDGGRLMRCYTQNIDGLEQKESLCMDLKRGRGTKTRFTKKVYESSRPQTVKGTDFDGGCEVVQLHGELGNLRCRVCAAESAWTEEDTEIFLEGAAPMCEKCADKSDQRQAKGKRGLAVGELRPNIVLYGEDHPQYPFITPLIPFDISSNPDVLIIMGTSLKVHGLQKIIRDFAKAVHERRDGRVIFVNRTRPAESVWEGIIDDWIAMDCDDWVRDLKQRKPELWLPQGDPNLLEIKHKTSKGKEKRKAFDDAEHPVPKKRKMLKFVCVEVPRIVHHVPDTKSSKSSSQKKPSLADTERKKFLDENKAQRPAEKRDRYTIWRTKRSITYDGRQVLSPLVQQRPKSSPLNLHFKSVELGDEYLPGSPITPPFSPLPTSRTTPRDWSVFDDSGAAAPTPSPHAKMHLQSQTLGTTTAKARREVYVGKMNMNFNPDARTPVKRQLSFINTGLEGERQQPLYARVGRGLFRTFLASEFLKRT